MEEIAPRIGPMHPIAACTTATTTRRGTVGLLTGCVQGSFFPQVNEATVRVLTAEGFDVVAPRDQGCCGALSGHVGREHEAQRFARSIIDLFEQSGVETVIVNSAGCGSAMKEYVHLLSGDNRYSARAERFSRMTADIAEFLYGIDAVAPRHPLPIAIAYHDACHLGHAQRIKSQPRELLGGIPGLEVREVAESDLCCGSAGVYNILQPEAAAELGARKAQNVVSTGAQLVVAANPGCTMQITTAAARAGTPLKTAHTIEIIDASIRGVPVDELLTILS
jgi:glycolate oxidase iron-sulfur subunit